MRSFQEDWKQQQIDAIADALHELMQGDNGVDDAFTAIDAAIDSWLTYFKTENEKWETLKKNLRR